jgi:RNA polymerase subunit RPABC4/transcription elongation factor Spt4
VELLPPSAIELRDRHPELATLPVSPAAAPEERYVELAQCDLLEAKTLTSLLKDEGIPYLLERRTPTREESLSADLEGAPPPNLLLTVPASLAEKARALLEWEFQQETEQSAAEEPDTETSYELCPACHAAVSPDAEFCPDCGLTFGPVESEEADEKDHTHCSVCGGSLDTEDSFCPTCGTRFDQ